ncbi:alpha/beta fold hydrolase [Leptotrichia sp. OH3620_COT-345]|uniref:alpha/beta fold hydrolase n=1 Tax=Leptotrichia sp. OH3620_COT-345 TaxID=2491048 RepID=UPI000F64931B|nr:alpha/beta fold hydrolase [Leptotrichia sp. OH3620_COT-345]RRD39781.1 alpha/beta fold hydrolase [Leptotrichia sp. OH3620_COT-345]
MGILITINILFMIFFFAVAYMSIRYFLNQIEKYPRITLDEVYNNKKLRQKYSIEEKVNPMDYGFNYKEIAYKSGKIQLYGWLIDNKDADKTVIISHGRGVNRLAALQYLQIFKDTELSDEYSFFIPDLRNSGKSDEAKTRMGYCFGQDIYHTMEMLNEKFRKNNFVLYGFSQGGMGSAIAAKIFSNELRKKGIKVDKLILDSSISNVRKRVKQDAAKRKVPKFIVSVVIRVFNLRVGNKLDKLRFSYLLRRIPTLIIQTKSDKATTYGMLMEEYNDIAQYKNVYLKVFEKGSHTRIYAEPEYKEGYTEVVGNFLKGIQNENNKENENIQLNLFEIENNGIIQKNKEKETVYYEKFSDFDYDEEN